MVWAVEATEMTESVHFYPDATNGHRIGSYEDVFRWWSHYIHNKVHVDIVVMFRRGNMAH